MIFVMFSDSNLLFVIFSFSTFKPLVDVSVG